MQPRGHAADDSRQPVLTVFGADTRIVAAIVTIYVLLSLVVVLGAAVEWIPASWTAVGVVLLALYARATLVFRGAWPLMFAAIPAVLLADLILYIDSDALDCYPSCTSYQLGLGRAMIVLVLLFGAVIALAAAIAVRRHI